MKFIELAIIIAIGWYAFDPRRLPKITRSIGDSIKGFKEGLNGKPNPPEELNGPKTDEVARDVTASSARAETFQLRKKNPKS
jgi:Sec-independent protein translocase protein TatA